MKQYKLKNAEQQKALEIAFPGFAKKLNQACKEQFEDPFSCVELENWDDGLYMSLEKTLIEESIPYDPNAWNDFPNVNPPEGVLMRIEYVCEGVLRRSCAILKKGHGTSQQTGSHRMLFSGSMTLSGSALGSKG